MNLRQLTTTNALKENIMIYITFQKLWVQLITLKIKVTTCVYLVYIKMTNKRNLLLLTGMKGTCNTTKFNKNKLKCHHYIHTKRIQ